ncbi:MAG TPA: translation factor GTPase family protein [Dehalococcoidia bacterium]|nr:translation factor GTPase family protein [Dehalococcoidia bacterium]
MRTLNLGILAHVDAGKTSLTERLLYAAGIIDTIGSVDRGTTQTDTLALERQRGITIKSAVVSFAVNGVTINLIDTPGHPDFIAEVERVLNVLDGAVLVLSAVEGVQPQTRILFRALQRLRIPTLLFVNKIDRIGARPESVLQEIAERLTPAIVAMGAVREAGTRAAACVPFGATDAAFSSRLAELLAEHDEALLAAYIGEAPAASYRRLRRRLAAQTKRSLVHPVFFGSAITGAGVEALTGGLTELLPATAGDAAGQLSGTVFKVDRGPAGEQIAWVRLFSGTVRVRERLPFGAGREAKVTAISVFERGTSVPGAALCAGQIGRLWGLGGVRIGDAIGAPRATAEHQFAPPTLETVILPRRAADSAALHLALTRLAEQDPLINLRHDDARHEPSISLYGEVQKEVIQATLANDFGVAVAFHESTTLHIERPAGAGAAVEFMHAPGNPFLATVGLRIEPTPDGSGVQFRTAVEVHGTMPAAFFVAIEETVHETLRQGLHGWQVTDCTVTLTHTGYLGKHGLGHQYFNKSMSSTGWDFRYLTPLVVMAALRQAGTTVHEPIHRFRLDVPLETLGAVGPALTKLDAVLLTSQVNGASCVLEGEIPAARVHALRQLLPGLSRGEGVLEAAFDSYRPLRGAPPERPRSEAGPNPLDRKAYLLQVTRRGLGQTGQPAAEGDRVRS